MNRRNLLKGVAGLTAGLLLPSTVAENAETARRYWALGAMPGKESPIIARAGDRIVMEMGGMLSMHGMTLTLKRADGGPDVVIYQGEPPLFGSIQIPNVVPERNLEGQEGWLSPRQSLVLTARGG